MKLIALLILFLSHAVLAQDARDHTENAIRRSEAAQAQAATRAQCNPMAPATPPPGGYSGWEADDINISNFTCGMGGADYCVLGDNAGRGDAMLDRLEAECPTTRHPTPLRDLGFLLVGPYADTTFFQELATRTVSATTCRIQILDPAQRQPLVDSSRQMFDEMQPLFQVLVQQRTIAAQQLEGLRMALADPRTAGPSGASAQRDRLNEQISGINTAISNLIAQMPFGETEPVKNALLNIAGRGASPAQFAAAYNGALNTVRTSYEEASCTYQSIRNPRSGVYRLNLSQKIALYNANGTQDLLRRIDPDGRGLQCQLNRCYVSGPRNVQYAAIAALIGVTILSAGTASPFVGAVATVGAIGFSATQIDNACRRPTITATADATRECTASAMARVTVDQVSYTGCAVEVALGSLDLLPGVAAARNLVRARRLARAQGATTDALTTAARTDGIISGQIRIGTEVTEETAEQTIVVTGRATTTNSIILRAEGRLTRGADPSEFFEARGYSRVTQTSPDVQVFRNASGEQIVIRSGARLSEREAGRIGDVLRRGRGSYSSPGVVADSTSARTLAAELGSADRARIVSSVNVTQPQTLDSAVADIFQLTARAEPQLGFAALNPAQRVRALDELENGLRIRDPAILNSPEYIAYKQRLQRELTTYSARVVGDSEDIALRIQDEVSGIPGGNPADDFRLVVAGRADEVIARSPGITVEQSARLRTLQDRVAEARRAIDEIPGARIPASLRLVDDVPPVPTRVVAGADETSTVTRADASRTNRTQLSREDLRALEDAGLRDLLARSLNRRVTGAAQDLERRVLLEDLQATFARWGNKREEVFRFLNNSTPALSTAERERYFAILVNSEDDVSAVILRLQRVRAGGAGRAEVFRLMDDRILELSRRVQEGVDNGTDIRLLAEQRSALVLERNLLELGDDLEIQRIFPARAHNDYSQAAQDGAEQGRHSLDGSFSLDVRARQGSDISVCRGSYITPGAVASNMVSGISGSFFTFCRSDGYLDRPVLGSVVAAPVDGTVNQSLQGYSRFNRFQLRPDMEISLGRNGPVTYRDADNVRNVTNGTGGPGGGIEFFVSRNGQRLGLEDLRASVRTPSCVRSSANPICDTIFRTQESLRAGNLRQGIAPEAIAAANESVDDILRELAPQIERYQQSLRTSSDSATLERLRAEYPEVVSALNLRRELEMKRRMAFGPRQPGSLADIDEDTARLIAFERSAGDFTVPNPRRNITTTGPTIERVRAAGGGDPARTAQALRQEISQSPIVQAYNQAEVQLRNLTTRLRSSASMTESQRADLLYEANTIAAQMDDMRLAANTVATQMRTAVTSSTLNLPPNLQRELLEVIRERLPHNI